MSQIFITFLKQSFEWLKKSITVLTRQYVNTDEDGNNSYQTFLNDIAPLKVSRLPFYIAGLSRHTRATPLTALLLIAAGAALNLINALDPDSSSEWRYLLGDTGLFFGSFRRVFNLCVGLTWASNVQFSTHTFLHWELNVFENFDITQSLAMLLIDQNLDSLALSHKEKIRLWKYSYIQYCIACWNAITFVPLAISFFTLCILTQTPATYLLAGIFWSLIFYPLNIIPTLFCFAFSSLIVIIEPLVFSSQMKFIRLQLLNVNNNFSDYEILRSIFKRWIILSSNFERKSFPLKSLCLTTMIGIVVGGLLWLYSALFLSSGSPLAAILTYSGALAILVCSTLFLANASNVAQEQFQWRRALYKTYGKLLAATKNQQDNILFSRKSEREIFTRSIQLVRRWIAFEDSANDLENVVLTFRCGDLFPITFYHSLIYALDMAGYFLLIVSTIEIPS